MQQPNVNFTGLARFMASSIGWSPVRFCLPLIAVLILHGSAAYGQRSVPAPQVAPDAWELVQDTMHVLRWYPNDTIPRFMICASYTYLMQYDSLCEVEYILTEWKHNGIPLRMPRWTDDRVVNAPADYLSFNSQTDTFTCRAGDTLSFFRWLSWQTLLPGHTGGGYAALDTLDFAMELVRHKDSARVALIDSMGVFPRTTPGRPYIYGARPLMAMVTYVVPPDLDGTRAFMRMRLYHRGGGDYWFTRRDGTTSNVSAFMKEPWYKDHVQYYSPNGFSKQVREHGARGSVTERLQVIGRGPGSRDIAIRLQGAPLGLSTSILVSDIGGQNLFYPMMWAPDVEGMVEIPYQFTQSGAYLVALIHENRLQEVVRWNVTE